MTAVDPRKHEMALLIVTRAEDEDIKKGKEMKGDERRNNTKKLILSNECFFLFMWRTKRILLH